ncbi:MAG: hypothetical protein K0R92_3300 [Lachnospiraceae bacterium]|jgi:hypothetical protein|nr:hypothetical protein [Lachnospiraceae bacterium]
MSNKTNTNEKSIANGWIGIKKIKDMYRSILYFLCLIILFWVCFSLGESDWPHRIGFAFHESFYIPVNIGLFLIPVVATIMIFIYLLRAIRKEDTKRNTIRLLLVTVISITHILLLTYVFSYTTISGYAVIDKKAISEDAYCIYINKEDYSIRLRCSSAVYDQVVTDENLAYKIVYKWSKLTPDKGKLIELIPTDTIDNR